MLKRIRNNKSGQAIVIVMVVAVILLAIGGTVKTVPYILLILRTSICLFYVHFIYIFSLQFVH